MERVENQVSSIPTKWMDWGRNGPPKETEVLFPEEWGLWRSRIGSEGQDPCTSTPRIRSHLLVAIVLSTVQEAEIISIVVPTKGATHCLLREIRPTELKWLRNDSKQSVWVLKQKLGSLPVPRQSMCCSGCHLSTSFPFRPTQFSEPEHPFGVCTFPHVVDPLEIPWRAGAASNCHLFPNLSSSRPVPELCFFQLRLGKCKVVRSPCPWPGF